MQRDGRGWSTPDLRRYFERTYRQDLTNVDDASLHQRAQSVWWWYHGGTLRADPECFMYSTDWSRTMCARAHAKHATLLLPSSLLTRNFNSFGRWQPVAMPGACSINAFSAPTFFPDHRWVEVLRLGIDFQEGGLYGCWFFASPGSGVFLNLGRSLRATNRSMLAVALQLNLTAKGRMFLDWNPWRLEHNTRICEFARARGFDSVQLGWEGCAALGSGPRAAEACFHEIISCHPQCLALPTPCTPRRQHQSSCARTLCPMCCRSCSSKELSAYVAWNATHGSLGPCINDEMFRTGWDASLPCMCDDSKRLLNCLGTRPDIPAASPSLHWVPADRSPSLMNFKNDTAKCLRLASPQTVQKLTFGASVDGSASRARDPPRVIVHLGQRKRPFVF